MSGGEADEPGAERRGEVRVPARLNVRYRLEGLESFVERYSANVSYNGIFIVTSEQPRVGAEVAFELRTAEGAVALAGSGLVRWVRPDTGSAAQPPGVGLQFTRLSEENRRRVRALVDHSLAAKLAGIEAQPPTARELAGAPGSPSPGEVPWEQPAPEPPPVAPPPAARVSGAVIVFGLLGALVLAGLLLYALFRR